MKVVFVHGALVFDGAWWWHRMTGPLADSGLESEAVELPSCVPGGGSEADMHADADAVRDVLDAEDEEVLLVGHSYGGMVITDAASGRSDVKCLIYLDAAMPDSDETMVSLPGEREPGPYMDPDLEGGTMGIKAELMPAAFMQDCDGFFVAGAMERLTRQPLSVFGQSPRGVAWREMPSTYIVCTNDLSTPSEAQRILAKRADEVVEIPTGHHPMLSHPRLLAEVIAKAASA